MAFSLAMALAAENSAFLTAAITCNSSILVERIDKSPTKVGFSRLVLTLSISLKAVSAFPLPSLSLCKVKDISFSIS